MNENKKIPIILPTLTVERKTIKLPISKRYFAN